MCGFSGFLSFTQNPLDSVSRRRVLEAMGRAIAHRGPDDQQFFDDGMLSLVFRRLSIVDTQGGRQPIFNEDGTQLIVCNGEIYNHGELRRNLAAKHQFKTQSDSEVVLHAFEDRGLAALQQVRGMFALAIWNRRSRQLFLARDRLGIKPLYICELPNGLLFGSELKALLAHPECPRQMDWAALETHSLSAVATPTYLKGVDYLPGGCYFSIEPGKRPQTGKYWRLDEHIGTARFGLNERQYTDEFDRLIEEATLEHLQGDGPVGIHLSGGVDSSLLTSIIASQRPDSPCFTILERTSYLVGDAAAAQEVASRHRLPWYPVLFDYQTLLNDMSFNLESLEQSVWMMDSPLFDIEWIIKGELNRAIRTQYPALKVLLLGQGADEFAGGYSKRADAPYSSWEHYLNEEVLPMLGSHLPNQNLHSGRHSVFSGSRNAATLTSPYHQLMPLMKRQLQHHNLWHEDRTSSWYGMEARVPFLDHRIVELLASVPTSLHKRLFWNKQIVRDCLHRRFPDYVMRGEINRKGWAR
jgi:asparagine synthase (glutamine-hydrolysing)